MAYELLHCDGTDEIYKPEWPPIVGDKTLEDGGRVGDLLTIARVHLQDAKKRGELREQDSGEAYSAAILEAFKSAIMFELSYTKAQLDTCLLKAQIDKLICDCNNDTKRTDSQVSLNLAQEAKLVCDCNNETRMTTSKIALNDAQMEKLECDCENETDMTASRISLNAAQENKLACDCCNDSARTAADVKYRMEQIEKSKCDCENSTKMADAQSSLYTRQARGFDDHILSKLYDQQLNAWAMVFADTDLPEVTDSIKEPNINETYKRLCGITNTSEVRCGLYTGDGNWEE